jgi:ankyrin repeat protein
MRRITVVSACLMLGAALPLAAQKDTREAKALKLPSARSTAVADAAEQGDLAAVKRLIAQGADVSYAQGDGMTALHWAADRGDTAMANALIAAHANLKASTRIGGYTPLHVASRAGNGAIVAALVKAGADVNAPSQTGAAPLHLAAASGDPRALNALLDAGANVNATEPEWNQTPLIFAAEYNRAAAITTLIKHSADVNAHTRVVNLTEETAAEQAAAKKRDSVLLSFMPKARRDSVIAEAAAAAAAGGRGAGGLGDDAGGGGGGGGRRAAAASGAAQQGAAGGGRRGGGPKPRGPFTPQQIQAAIDSGRAVLLKGGAGQKMTEEVDSLNGGVAGFVGSVGGVGGLTALHHAARQGNVEAVTALLDGGANIDDATTVDHTTPLLLATINGQFDVAKLLIERGANVNARSTAGATPLYTTINAEWAPKSRYPQPQAVQNQKTDHLEIMQLLLEHGADPNVRLTKELWYFAFNNCGNANCGLEYIEGTTPFWRAAYALDVPAMKLLVKYHADPNIPSQRTAAAGGRGGGRGGAAGGRGGGGAGGAALGGGRGQAPAGPPLDPAIDSAAKAAPVGIGVYAIHAAAGVGYGNGFAGNSHRHAPDAWMAAMKYLVEDLHADVNARDNTGYTPLHHAAARGDNEMILYLVAHGADVKAVSRNGRTTVDMANGPVQRLSPFPETIALLEKLGAKNQHRCVSC